MGERAIDKTLARELDLETERIRTWCIRSRFHRQSLETPQSLVINPGDVGYTGTFFESERYRRNMLMGMSDEQHSRSEEKRTQRLFDQYERDQLKYYHITIFSQHQSY